MTYEQVSEVKKRHLEFFVQKGGHSIGVGRNAYHFEIVVSFRGDVPPDMPSELEGVKVHYEGHRGNAVAGG